MLRRAWILLPWVLGGFGCDRGAPSGTPPPSAQARPAPSVEPERWAPPRLRTLSAVRVEHDGETLILLRDPFGYADEPMVLTGPGFFAASNFDGTRTLGAIATDIERRSGVQVNVRDLHQLADSLDQALLLESPRFLTMRNGIDRAFAESRVRPPANAGAAYPEDARSLRERFDGYFGRPLRFGVRRGPLRAIVSPHIDPRHGFEAYVAAYREIAEVADDVDLVILLGTAHAPIDGFVALTKKDYGTPLGPLGTDGAAVERLARRLGPGAFRNEWAHRTEHADEFQAVFLQYLFAGRRRVRAVPVLIGSLDEFIENMRDPLAEPELRNLVAGLREIETAERAAGRRVLYLAGVDLTHRGTRFGDPAVAPARVLGAKRDDLPFLHSVVRGDAAAALADARHDRGARRYCGFAPLYVLATLLDRTGGGVLAQGADLTAGSLVTFAAAAVR